MQIKFQFCYNSHHSTATPIQFRKINKEEWTRCESRCLCTLSGDEKKLLSLYRKYRFSCLSHRESAGAESALLFCWPQQPQMLFVKNLSSFSLVPHNKWCASCVYHVLDVMQVARINQMLKMIEVDWLLDFLILSRPLDDSIASGGRSVVTIGNLRFQSDTIDHFLFLVWPRPSSWTSNKLLSSPSKRKFSSRYYKLKNYTENREKKSNLNRIRRRNYY